MERIERAAIRIAYSIDRPGRHHDIYRRLRGPDMDWSCSREEGFVTSTGRFVDRLEARKIAEAAGQIIAGRVGSDGIPFTSTDERLFSEDVW